jgi:tRNA (uracil-5-)-methyltransferase
VAVVDPPRGGLHQDVLRALRTCRALKRVVYVSCNPAGSLVEDAALLCAPQQHGGRSAARGPPFRCVAAFPVDLFPHTPHAEMVLLLERD